MNDTKPAWIAAPSRQSSQSLGAGPNLFPQPVAHLVTALTTYLDDKFHSANETIGIGSEPVRGRVVVAADASDAIDRIEPGDILVTGATTPAYSAILPIVSDIVVTEGGASCHAAVMARELGLPAIVGHTDALTTIPRLRHHRTGPHPRRREHCREA